MSRTPIKFRIPSSWGNISAQKHINEMKVTTCMACWFYDVHKDKCWEPNINCLNRYSLPLMKEREYDRNKV